MNTEYLRRRKQTPKVIQLKDQTCECEFLKISDMLSQIMYYVIGVVKRNDYFRRKMDKKQDGSY